MQVHPFRSTGVSSGQEGPPRHGTAVKREQILMQRAKATFPLCLPSVHPPRARPSKEKNANLEDRERSAGFRNVNPPWHRQLLSEDTRKSPGSLGNGSKSSWLNPQARKKSATFRRLLSS